MRKQTFIILILYTLTAGSTALHSDYYNFKPPANFPPIIYDTAGNKLTRNGIALGKKLFYDPILSRNNTISCGSCHKQQHAFSDAGNKISKGVDFKTGSRNTPAIMNLAWSEYFFWDGSVNALDLQPVMPITNHVEMDETLDNITAKLKANPEYVKLYTEAFGPGDINFSKTAKAISQFLITCISANSRYDKAIRKEGPYFTKDELKGYELFRQFCSSCHTEPLFSNGGFANNSIGPGIYKDEGRYGITSKMEDKYMFKVPSLRNITLTAPYMHDGRFATLEEVLEHYRLNLNTHSKSSTITADDKARLILFLQTLTDSSFIQNSSLGYD